MKYLITATAAFGALAAFTPNDALQTGMILCAVGCGLMTFNKGMER